MAQILVIATGGVRAHRQLEVAELLLEEGHSVRLLNSSASYKFLIPFFIKHPLRFFTFIKLKAKGLSLFSLLGPIAEMTGVVSHIETAKWADAIVVAPVTCNSMAKIVNGITDNFPLLVIRVLNRNKKVFLVPSMNPEMWADPFNQLNVKKINEESKYVLIGPVIGKSVSGDVGVGIMAESSQIVQTINQSFRLRRVA